MRIYFECDASTGRQIKGKSGIPWNKQSTSLVDNCLLGSKYFHLPGKINNFISNNVIITYSKGIHDELVPNNIPTCSNIIAINPSGDT